MDEFIGKDAAFVKDWLVRQGLEKLVDVFKHINISDHGELYFGTKQNFAFKTSQEIFNFMKVLLKH